MNSVYVEELGATLSREDIFRALVSDMMAGAIEVDWRDFFPYLKWIPNRSFERKIQNLSFCRKAITKALIRDHKKLIASGEVPFFRTHHLPFPLECHSDVEINLTVTTKTGSELLS